MAPPVLGPIEAIRGIAIEDSHFMTSRFSQFLLCWCLSVSVAFAESIPDVPASGGLLESTGLGALLGDRDEDTGAMEKREFTLSINRDMSMIHDTDVYLVKLESVFLDLTRSPVAEAPYLVDDSRR